MSKGFYITTPLYYVNAPPSWGAYTTIVADSVRRYKRMHGIDAHLVTGTDEHGQKIERSAKARGITPKALADEIVAQYRDLWEKLGIEYDGFIRTTDAKHVPAVQEMYLRAKAAGFIYKGSYSGWYCVACESYAAETDPAKPTNCADCGRPTEWTEEESYFFKLSAFTEKLLEYYDQHPDFIRPATRRNEIASFVKGGLRDLSISRATLKWGIPLPDDPKHVFYVWFDALTGYLSAIGFKSGVQDAAQDAGQASAQFDRQWPAAVHLVGKEIVRFHTVYWPAFLMAAGLPIPECVFGHGFWLASGEKMSKSKGNAADPFVLQAVFGSEALRYFLLREMVFGQDCNFSLEAMVQRANSDLANGLGNLLSRTTAMISKYRAGIIPSPGTAKGDADVRETATRTIVGYRSNFEDYAFSRALENVWELIARVDKYIVENEPWKLAASPTEAGALDSVLFHASESLRLAAAMLAPVLPKSAQSVWEQLGLSGAVTEVRLDALAWSSDVAGKTIRPGSALFPRLDAKEVFKKLDEAAEAAGKKSGGVVEEKVEVTPVVSAVPAGTPATSEVPAVSDVVTADAPPPVESIYPPLEAPIVIDDFGKIDLRVATVVEAEKVKGADKLLRLIVDLGFEKRQIVAGIATAYAPESLVGRKVAIVANLQPRKLRGLESNGMVVAASLGSGDKPALVSFLEDVPNGARLR